jgi:hypothetical protein
MAQQVLTTIAYAKNGSVFGSDVVDRKAVQIPTGWKYFTHSTAITTASPQDGEGGRWWRSDGVDRNPHTNEITSVWVEARAGTKSTFGVTIWVGVQLSVTVHQ